MELQYTGSAALAPQEAPGARGSTASAASKDQPGEGSTSLPPSEAKPPEANPPPAEAAPVQKSSLLMRQILAYIRQKGLGPLGLEELAERFLLSPNYLSALIKKESGKTLGQHLLELRMERACQLLTDPLMPIQQVASASGYESYITFYQAFRKQFGMTPTAYRNQL